MGIRQNTASFSRRLREQVRSTLLDGTDATDDETGCDDGELTDGGSDDTSNSSGNLFHCSACSVVYIAAEKRICPSCEGDVEQVRSTLACNRQ